MKSRQKTHDAVIHDDLISFSAFLKAMGPRPSQDHTLDRENPHDTEYSPKKCNWADKRDQANNRRMTRKLTYQGVEKPIAEWAREYGLKPDTLRRRLTKGWSQKDVLFGRTSNSQSSHISNYNYRRAPSVPELWPWLGLKISLLWEEHYKSEHTFRHSRWQYFLDSTEGRKQKIFDKLNGLYDINCKIQNGERLDNRDHEIIDLFELREDEIEEHFKSEKKVIDEINTVLEKHARYKRKSGIFHLLKKMPI